MATHKHSRAAQVGRPRKPRAAKSVIRNISLTPDLLGRVQSAGLSLSAVAQAGAEAASTLLLDSGIARVVFVRDPRNERKVLAVIQRREDLAQMGTL